MINYKLTRYEKNKDHDGKVVSIFVATSTRDDAVEETVTTEKWLSQDEIDAVLLDEVALKPIINTMCAEGFVKLEKQIATKPEPAESGELFEIDSTDVDSAVEAAAAAAAEAAAAAAEDSE
jgi:hypothetical protein|tara:strand:+ start:1300 stop:1662 length:363 start_codon:yes stop_codon:yes gene_type:complete